MWEEPVLHGQSFEEVCKQSRKGRVHDAVREDRQGAKAQVPEGSEGSEASWPGAEKTREGDRYSGNSEGLSLVEEPEELDSVCVASGGGLLGKSYRETEFYRLV